MPIIINEFEFAPEPPSERPSQQAAAEPQPDQPIPDPNDIIRAQRLYFERRRRLHAD